MFEYFSLLLSLFIASSELEIKSLYDIRYPYDRATMKVRRVKSEPNYNDSGVYSFYTEVSGQPRQLYWIVVKDALGNYYPQPNSRRQANATGKARVQLVIGNISSYPLKFFVLNVTGVDDAPLHRDELLSSSRTAIPLSNDWVQTFGLDRHAETCTFDLVEQPSIKGIDKRLPVTKNCMSAQ